METCVLQANFCDGAWESFLKGGLKLDSTSRNSGWLNFTSLIALGSLMMRIYVLHVNFCDRRCWGLLKGGLQLISTSRNSGWLNFTPLIALGSLMMRICVLQVIFCDWRPWGLSKGGTPSLDQSKFRMPEFHTIDSRLVTDAEIMRLTGYFL